MGTPEFAVDSLKKMYENYDVVAVYTKVDKPNSRGKKINYSPVKTFALEHDIPVIQPDSFKDAEVINTLKSLAPDLLVVVAYGKILPKEVLAIPKYGAINVHSSLLPKYRGAAPINMAIMQGEEKSGVSIMHIVEELDAGPVILAKESEITDEDTFLTLHDRLKDIGAEALLEACTLIFEGKAEPQEQDETKVSFVKPFKKEDLRIDWTKTQREIFNFVRGLNPFPCAYTYSQEKLFKIYALEEYNKKYEAEDGEIVDVVKGKGFVVKVKDGSLILKEVKPENKKVLSGSDIINGKYFNLGDKLC